jgi:hypothetical protein
MYAARAFNCDCFASASLNGPFPSQLSSVDGGILIRDALNHRSAEKPAAKKERLAKSVSHHSAPYVVIVLGSVSNFARCEYFPLTAKRKTPEIGPVSSGRWAGRRTGQRDRSLAFVGLLNSERSQYDRAHESNNCERHQDIEPQGQTHARPPSLLRLDHFTKVQGGIEADNVLRCRTFPAACEIAASTS